MKISNIKSNEQEKRKEFVKEKIKNLSKEECQSLEQDFEDHLEQENNSMTEEFRKSRWNGMFISAYFKGFVEEKIFSQVFGHLDKDHDEKIIRSSGFLELLDEACHELNLIKQKKRSLELRSVPLEFRDFDSSTQNPLIDSDFDSQSYNPLAIQLANPQNRLDGVMQRPLSWV